MPAITAIEFRRFSANHRNASRNWLCFVIRTDDPAIYGLGDASPMQHDEQVMGLAGGFADRYLIGRDPLDIDVLWTEMYHDPHARGGRLATTALSGIDIALWDIKGKLLGQPIYKLLGGAHRDSLRVYANGWYTNPGTPQQNADEARAVVDRGYTAMKFDPFGQGNYYTISAAEADLAEQRVAAVRDAVGPHVDILVEAHAKWNVMTAIGLGQRLTDYRPMWYEEPVSEERVSELLEVRRKVDIPIATGERLYTKFPFAEIVEAHAADVLQPDVANAGGITELRKIAAIAEAKHITLAPHNVCSPVGAMAEMHLGAAIVNFEIQEYHAEYYDDHYFEVSPGSPRQPEGVCRLTDAPGRGLEIDERAIAAHPPMEKTTARGGTVRGI